MNRENLEVNRQFVTDRADLSASVHASEANKKAPGIRVEPGIAHPEAIIQDDPYGFEDPKFAHPAGLEIPE
jgi:hypothetical protein